jgi:hypothetical protein
MRISEYIAELEKLKSDSGDIEVLIWNRPMGDISQAPIPHIAKRAEGDLVVVLN